ncbi:MAG TPA: hypothetical protein VHL59_05480, partial [Thermoanaerobaculia bacterium]|nr:hypothetical protein [Thermoanaerobaculia bacterium]
PGSRKRLVARGESRRPWTPFAIGDELKIDGVRARIRDIATRVERRGDVVEHVQQIFTSAIARRRRKLPKNVVAMPAADDSVIAQFIRYHVLVRVFGGDADAWIEHLRTRGEEEGDMRFARWIRTRLRKDPTLLESIRRMVEATPFWRAAEA